ncbi:MAG: hypothetical protein K9H64_22515 [Bacteroidales bacterium]|nr:hypothetical protein [Bacteroidales bacterium]MCF8458803.1 hypothetical protein [Bacteroidales bacterium]
MTEIEIEIKNAFKYANAVESFLFGIDINTVSIAMDKLEGLYRTTTPNIHKDDVTIDAIESIKTFINEVT